MRGLCIDLIVLLDESMCTVCCWCTVRTIFKRIGSDRIGFDQINLCVYTVVRRIISIHTAGNRNIYTFMVVDTTRPSRQPHGSAVVVSVVVVVVVSSFPFFLFCVTLFYNYLIFNFQLKRFILWEELYVYWIWTSIETYIYLLSLCLRPLNAFFIREVGVLRVTSIVE